MNVQDRTRLVAELMRDKDIWTTMDLDTEDVPETLEGPDGKTYHYTGHVFGAARFECYE